MLRDNKIIAVRGRYIGRNFDIHQVGFVPWTGTWELTGIGGPRWYYKDGYLQQLLIYAGGSLGHEQVDAFTDRSAVLGINMGFRTNWGFEVTRIGGRSKDQGKEFDSYEVDLSSWLSVSPKWNANVFGGYQKTYNFSREYLAFYSWAGSQFGWHALDVLDVGTSVRAFIEGNPDNRIEDVTYNARPYLSLTPVNDLNLRLYVDNVYVRSTKRLERMIVGFLFSYNFLPKSWIYFALNEIRDRSEEYGPTGILLPERLHVADRAAVVKLKYLFYF